MPEIKKGNNSANNVSGVTSFNLCRMAGHALHCTKFREIISNDIKVIYRADTNSILKISKGNNSAKNVGGVNVVNLCTPTGHALYLCQVS